MNEDERSDQPQLSPPPEEKKSPEESIKELQEAIQGSNEVLVQATTTMSLFPDTLTVDRAKLTVTKRTFIQSSEVMSLRIEDILNVTTTLGPLFGSVKIMSRVLSEDQADTVGRFWRKDAERIKRITQGYVIALQRKIDCSALATKELAQMLERLGADSHPS